MSSLIYNSKQRIIILFKIDEVYKIHRKANGIDKIESVTKV